MSLVNKNGQKVKMADGLSEIGLSQVKSEIGALPKDGEAGQVLGLVAESHTEVIKTPVIPTLTTDKIIFDTTKTVEEVCAMIDDYVGVVERHGYDGVGIYGAEVTGYGSYTIELGKYKVDPEDPEGPYGYYIDVFADSEIVIFEYNGTEGGWNPEFTGEVEFPSEAEVWTVEDYEDEFYEGVVEDLSTLAEKYQSFFYEEKTEVIPGVPEPKWVDVETGELKGFVDLMDANWEIGYNTWNISQPLLKDLYDIVKYVEAHPELIEGYTIVHDDEYSLHGCLDLNTETTDQEYLNKMFNLFTDGEGIPTSLSLDQIKWSSNYSSYWCDGFVPRVTTWDDNYEFPLQVTITRYWTYFDNDSQSGNKNLILTKESDGTISLSSSSDEALHLGIDFRFIK